MFQKLPGSVEELLFLAVSDASHSSMPKGRSQGGMMILVANERITEEETTVNCLLYHSAVLKRVVRSSLAAEISQAAETMEQCDYVQAMFADRSPCQPGGAVLLGGRRSLSSTPRPATTC